MAERPEAPPDAPRTVLVPMVALVALALLLVALFAGRGGSDEVSADAEAGAVIGDTVAPDRVDEVEPDAAVGGDDAQLSPAEIQAALQELERRDDGDELALGAVDAPVVMILWSDFQCPFCASFARDTKPALVDRFVDEGTLRIEWRDYPLLGEASVTAALAGRAAAEQGAFWALHDAIFAEDRERDALTREVLIGLADELGLDTDRFAADLEDETLWQAVASDQATASQLGISGTPAFLVNGTPVLGVQPVEHFVRLIEHLADDA